MLEYAKYFSVTETCKEFNVPRSSFYEWKKNYDQEGPSGLYRKKPVAHTHPRKTSPEVVDKILELRSVYQLGSKRIVYYLARYHGITISESTVTRVLRAHGVNRLPKTAPKRALHSKRYAKTVPEHHVQVDVKFLQLHDDEGKVVKRYQYTAIDDATRVRALKIFPKHNQDAAIQFIDYVIEKFPFRIILSEPIVVMSFKLASTGTLKIRGCSTPTLNPEHRNSMAKSNAHIERIRQNFTSS